ncbi:MAG: DHHA1 domain-containing protein, partial [Acidaminobacteraceae bacterium]
IAPLNDENRIISKIGLEAINAYTSVGISALIEESGLGDKEINSGHIGFMIAPKINAAGRIGSPSLAVELLTTYSDDHAREIAKELCDLNDRRQEIEKQILKEAIDYVENSIDLEKEKILIVEGHNWHTGIIGIVSSRISEKYYRPSVILNIEDGVAKGSARSVGRFSIFDALNSCKDLFIKFGGHDQAAGLSLDASNINELRKRINKYGNDNISEFDLIPIVSIEDKLKSSDITYKLIDELTLFEPYGVGNPKPVFSYENLSIDQVRLIGKDKSHLKMSVHDQTRIFDCLGFGMGEKFAYFRTNDSVNMAFTLEKNNFRGVETIQFMIKDIKSTHIDDDKSKELLSTYTHKLFEYIDTFESGSKFENKFTNDLLINKLELVELIASDERVNIYVNTIDGIKDFYLNYFDKVINNVTYHWDNDKKDITKKINVFFLSPAKSAQGIDIIYDECLSHEELCTFEINNMKLHNFKSVKDSTKEIIRSSIPDREDLKNIYIFIKQNAAKEVSFSEVISKTNINQLKLLLSLSLMIKEGLIKGNFNENTMNVELIPATTKINILETSYYKSMQDFKESYFALKALSNDLY